jgi:hypothetical protein
MSAFEGINQARVIAPTIRQEIENLRKDAVYAMETNNIPILFDDFLITLIFLQYKARGHLVSLFER